MHLVIHNPDQVNPFILISNIGSKTKSNEKQQVDSSPQKSTLKKASQALSPQKINTEVLEAQLYQDNLKSAIRALNEKLKFYENVERDKDIIQTQFSKADEARDELRNNIKENAERIKEDTEKSNKYQQILINENESLSKQILMITDMFSKKVAE